jgi:hypothetical protein
MNMIKGLQAERLIAERYEERGYVVTIGPPRSAIPFALGNYIPDILATKGDENILIEVKPSGARIDSELYFRLDEEVQQHPGWRFLLVTVGDAELQEHASGVATRAGIESIRENLSNMDQLVEDPKISRLLLPALWMTYVAALRLLVVDGDIGADGYSDLSLMNKAYSTGVISNDEYQAARRLMTLRNQTLHSFDTSATPDDCKQLRQMVGTLLARLPSSPTPTPLMANPDSE